MGCCQKGASCYRTPFYHQTYLYLLSSPRTPHSAIVTPLGEELLNGFKWNELTDGKFSKPMQPVAAEFLVQNEEGEARCQELANSTSVMRACHLTRVSVA